MRNSWLDRITFPKSLVLEPGGRVGGGARPNRFPQQDGSFIDRLGSAADGLERQRLFRHFDEHERSIRSEALGIRAVEEARGGRRPNPTRGS